MHTSEQERLVSDQPRFISTVTLPALETPEGTFEEPSFQVGASTVMECVRFAILGAHHRRAHELMQARGTLAAEGRLLHAQC